MCRGRGSRHYCDSVVTRIDIHVDHTNTEPRLHSRKTGRQENDAGKCGGAMSEQYVVKEAGKLVLKKQRWGGKCIIKLAPV